MLTPRCRCRAVVLPTPSRDPSVNCLQIAEQRGDLAGNIFVDAVQADEGVENEQTWPQVLDGLGKEL